MVKILCEAGEPQAVRTELSVGTLRKHTHAGSGAHETIERPGVGAELDGQLLGRFWTGFHQIRNSHLSEARNRAGDVRPIQHLQDSDVWRKSLRLWCHPLQYTVC